MEQETKTKEQQLRFTDLAKALERVSLPEVWAWATHYCFPRKSTRCGYSSKDARQSLCRPSRPSCQGPGGVSCFCALCCRMR